MRAVSVLIEHDSGKKGVTHVARVGYEHTTTVGEHNQDHHAGNFESRSLHYREPESSTTINATALLYWSEPQGSAIPCRPCSEGLSWSNAGARKTEPAVLADEDS